jgi:hypothetical protein
MTVPEYKPHAQPDAQANGGPALAIGTRSAAVTELSAPTGRLPKTPGSGTEYLFVHGGRFAFTSEMSFATFDIEPQEALLPEHVIVYGEPGHATFPGRRPASGRGRERRAPSARGRDGGVVIADGPFAETKEQIAGVLIVECADRSEAIKVAA